MSKPIPMTSAKARWGRLIVIVAAVLAVITLFCSPDLLFIMVQQVAPGDGHMDARPFYGLVLLFSLWQAAVFLSTAGLAAAASLSPDPSRAAAVWRWVLGVRWYKKALYLLPAEYGWFMFLLHRFGMTEGGAAPVQTAWQWVVFVLMSWLVYLVPVCLVALCGYESEDSYRRRNGYPPRRKKANRTAAAQAAHDGTLGTVVPQQELSPDEEARLAADIAAVESSGMEPNFIHSEIENLRRQYAKEK